MKKAKVAKMPKKDTKMPKGMKAEKEVKKGPMHQKMGRKPKKAAKGY